MYLIFWKHNMYLLHTPTLLLSQQHLQVVQCQFTNKAELFSIRSINLINEKYSDKFDIKLCNNAQHMKKLIIIENIY